ncbi:peptidase M52 [Mycobacterium paraense]|uniref:Peptidase M52 n=1 Tax=Mycobacterium paraense TaxID=767916 RepID=A0A1X2A7L7_9MYCO|nr:hydrogenase maturation protease [Mycobacterium paraense]ORW43259.1 peptidase M52 [Mycobacterium paraense]
MTGGIVDAVVIGLGNRYRRDDGVGVAVADELNRLGLNGVRVVTDIVEPMSLLEAWSDARLAVVIDGAVGSPPAPGRVRRCSLSDVTAGDGLSSHSVDLVRTHALGEALGRLPGQLVLLTVDVADTGHGAGLTPAVARAVPEVVGMAVDVIAGIDAEKRRERA